MLVMLVVAVIAGVAGPSVLLVGARRDRTVRCGLAKSRRETAAVSQARDDLIGQRDTARAYAASTPGDDGTARNGSDPGLRGPSLFAQRPPRGQRMLASQASVPVPAAQPESGRPGHRR